METKISDHLEQPDKYTCQSAAIAKVLGGSTHHDVMKVRRSLLNKARARGSMSGDPSVMADYLEPRVQEYKYLPQGSLVDLLEWVSKGPGYEAIIHGFSTTSGHVWGVEDIHKQDQFLYFKCDDPWYEYDFPNARFTQRPGANVLYSEVAMWSHCVKAWSFGQAVEAYREGIQRYYEPGFVEKIMKEPGAWIHLIRN